MLSSVSYWQSTWSWIISNEKLISSDKVNRYGSIVPLRNDIWLEYKSVYRIHRLKEQRTARNYNGIKWRDKAFNSGIAARCNEINWSVVRHKTADRSRHLRLPTGLYVKMLPGKNSGMIPFVSWNHKNEPEKSSNKATEYGRIFLKEMFSLHVFPTFRQSWNKKCAVSGTGTRRSSWNSFNSRAAGTQVLGTDWNSSVDWELVAWSPLLQ